MIGITLWTCNVEKCVGVKAVPVAELFSVGWRDTNTEDQDN
jgi:hypothetical protein